MNKHQRAVEIHRQVLAMDDAHGRWENPIENLPDVRLRIIDAGLGWNAMITTPFSGRPTDLPEVRSYEEAVSLRQHVASLLPNSTDLYLNAGGKVMSVEWNTDELKIVSFTPGPWETAFGLPTRAWPNSARPTLRASWA